jgi:hypothetical protein
MKTYTVYKHRGNDEVEIKVNVPTPKEFQSTTIRCDYCVVVTNFSNEYEHKYSVASYELETDPALILLVLTHKIKSNHVFSTSGKNARSDVIDYAAGFLIGRY